MIQWTVTSTGPALREWEHTKWGIQVKQMFASPMATTDDCSVCIRSVWTFWTNLRNFVSPTRKKERKSTTTMIIIITGVPSHGQWQVALEIKQNKQTSKDVQTSQIIIIIDMIHTHTHKHKLLSITFPIIERHWPNRMVKNRCYTLTKFAHLHFTTLTRLVAPRPFVRNKSNICHRMNLTYNVERIGKSIEEYIVCRQYKYIIWKMGSMHQCNVTNECNCPNDPIEKW